MDPWTYAPARDLALSGRARLQSVAREPGPAEAILPHAAWAVLRVYLLLHQRLRVIGRGALPARPPFVLVSNHTSHLDALALGSLVPARARSRTFPIAAGDTFFDTPTAAALSALALNALPLWRRRCGTHALDTLRERLVAEPCAYVLFPEGTRSRDGALGPFHAGVGRLVARTDVPVVPAHVAGAFEAWPPSRHRPRRGRVVVRLGTPLRFGDVGNDRAGWDHIAAELRAAVLALAPKSR